ncbi:monovalent cation/H+ antiporter subunit D [Caldimonas tepidiphila]|uniref:monovalent cation/H+ antiporter subunit D n=1 Tax=Caldimonas tepidiphila TaxID=2315841 RepID=UPI00196A7BB9|nr:monovalent cation/H+ antiporter subunit D [Caldimonas tepidiphila]
MISETTNPLMTHLPVLAVLLPAFTAMLMLLIGDNEGLNAHGNPRLRLRRMLSLLSVGLGLAIALTLVGRAAEGELIVYRLGDWQPPFGIALVVDRLSALMLLIAQLVALPVLWYASGGWDTQGRHFHALFQFQLMGLAGAFVTGDLFNLFVFFEVLLIASYVLLLHGQGQARLKYGVHYVVLNLAASALFLIGLALIYATTGTLSMADLMVRAAAVEPAQVPVLQGAALLLLVVFGLKAALVPLHLWLPATYAAASPPVAALFAIMTKVGCYSIIRVHGTIFGPGAGELAMVAQPWLLPLAIATSVLGVVGALAANSMARMVAYLTVSSVGTILIGTALYDNAALSASLYYMAHSTLVIAGLFLLVELVGSQRGEMGDRLRPAAPLLQPVLLGLMMLLGAASVAGVPPLPGFLGKLMLLQSSTGSAAQPWVWTSVLLVGFLSLVGLARAGSILFWNVRSELPRGGGSACSAGASPKLVASTVALLLAGVLIAVAAGPIKRYTDDAAAQLADRAAYAHAVLGPEGLDARTTRPYTGEAGTAPEPLHRPIERARPETAPNAPQGRQP